MTEHFEKFLSNLREDIVLGSLYISDYRNRYGLDPNGVCGFFDGYLDYLGYMMEEDIPDYKDDKFFDYLPEYDNMDTLLGWFMDCEGCIGSVDVWALVDALVDDLQGA